MRAIRLACAALLLPLFAYAQPAPAQEPASAAEPTFRTGIRLVRVDVTVSSRKGEPITGLTADDFEVLEDEVPQKIESLQFVRLSGSPPPDDDLSLTIRSPEHAAQEAARDDVRVLVIFVDDYHLRYGPLHDHQLKQVLRRFVMAEMKPLDLFAVMGPLTPISDLGLTRNRQEILDRIHRLEGRLGGFVPPRSALEENQFSLNPAARARVRAQISLAALQSLAVHLGGLREGRKSVLFVSQGPPIIADRMGLFNQVRDVVTSANTSNVTIHTMDPRELGASTGLSATNEIFSAETGGRRLAQSNDHTRGLQAVMMDASAYYLIGYAPERELADGKFHRIQVKVRRKGVRVLARKGYWAPGAAEMEPPKTTPPPADVTRVLTSLALEERPLPVRDSVTVGPMDAGTSPVTIACTPSTPDEEISAVIADVMGEGDIVRESHAARLVEPDGVWLASFRAAPGAGRVRLTVRDEEGDTVDSWVRTFEVPGVNDVTAHVGTPVVYRARTPAAYRELSAGKASVPTTERHFHRTDRVIVRLPLSRDAMPSEIRAELVNGRGQTLLDLPVLQQSGGPQVELPVASLAQAAYVLRLTARFDGATASRLVSFAVVP